MLFFKRVSKIAVQEINNFMNDFKEWLWQQEFEHLIKEFFECYITPINEALNAKMPNDPRIAKDRLLNHIRHHYGKPTSIKPIMVIDTIRHIFTNYDDEWKTFERTKTNSDLPIPVKFIHPVTKQSTTFDLGDPCDHIEYWNTLVQATGDLVDQIIPVIAQPKNHKKLMQANQEWRNKKTRITC